ncbi:MAG: hypothetical protein H6Q15_1533, partial [Bacteroidetes bacterium]|nr:hypothetical protein [Bacteroidota bacterium]
KKEGEFSEKIGDFFWKISLKNNVKKDEKKMKFYLVLGELIFVPFFPFCFGGGTYFIVFLGLYGVDKAVLFYIFFYK